jgi:Phage integrase, N-terminal SAM-like domain
MEQLLLTAEETAEVLGIGRSKVYELLRAAPSSRCGSAPAGASRRLPSSTMSSGCGVRRQHEPPTTRARGGLDLSAAGWTLDRDDRPWLAGRQATTQVPLRQTRAEAAQKLAVALKAHRDGQVFGDERTTVEQFLHAWLRSVEPSVGPRTWIRYEELIRLHAVPHIGKVRLTRLGGTAARPALR